MPAAAWASCNVKPRYLRLSVQHLLPVLPHPRPDSAVPLHPNQLIKSQLQNGLWLHDDGMTIQTQATTYDFGPE